ncbi:hypothetical protein AB0N62_37210 [Streptomyces sp. NPDC093982]|uniref:hypothetical protein n=1 Tax=Streptomyces sp. NPDC093982 TaxID=3155077 RepID=UPI0034137ED9
MLTGQQPFTLSSWHLINQQLNEQPAPLLKRRLSTHSALVNLVERLLAKNSDDRPASAFEVMLALREIDRRYFDEGSPNRGLDTDTSAPQSAPASQPSARSRTFFWQTTPPARPAPPSPARPGRFPHRPGTR